jgi:CubicO group peptidase (beta-lactamase class C family)
VRIGLSEAVAVPLTLGFIRPVILIPTEIMRQLDQVAFAQVLGHELGHVARRDDWIRLAQRVLAAVFFFQPAVHWASRRIELERELACDDWALARTGAQPDVYARCLLRVGQLAARRGRAPGLALSMASQLRTRVQALLAPRPSRAGVPVGASLGLGTMACGVTMLLLATPGVRIERGTIAAAAGDGPDAPVSARVDAVLRRYEEYGFHGAVLLARGDRVMLSGGYGLADRSVGIPWTASTAFNGGAVAKMLTAAAILKLEEQGRLRVTDRITDYLGAFPAPKDRATLHHLLTHTAGLARPWAPVYRTDRDGFIRAMKSTPLDYRPGEGHRYTDLGHALLAAVIEVASGMRYEEYVRTALLEPAGMSNTRFENEPATTAPMAVEYLQAAGAESQVGPRDYPWGRRGAMGVVTTLEDLWRWHRALEQGVVLGREARARMLTAWVDAGRSTWIGYGWEVGRSDRGTRIRHRLSAWNSNSVEVVYDEDEDLFIALVANAPTNWGRPKYLELMDAALGRPHLLPPEPRPAAASELTGLEGRYRTDSGAGVEVRATGEGRIHLVALGEDDEIADLLGGARMRNNGAVVVARAVAGAPGEFRLLDWSRHRVLGLRFDGTGASSLVVRGGARTLSARRVTH